MHPDKLKNVQNLSPQDRYGYFIRKVADTEEVWLLQEDGKYVTLGDSTEQVAIPVWPEKEFADLLLTDDWQGCTSISMEVHDFIDWLDQLEEQAVQIAGFPLSDLNAVVVSAEEMKNHLLYELQQYEWVAANINICKMAAPVLIWSFKSISNGIGTLKLQEHRLQPLHKYPFRYALYRMTFTEDDIIHPIETENAPWSLIQQALSQIQPAYKSFFVLTNSSTGSYIQCAGSAERLTVEMRKYGTHGFRHYVIGRGGNKSPLKVVWAMIESKAGSIQVHDNEVLNITDAETLFHSFYTAGDVPEAFTKRNVTKLYLQQ